MKQILSIVAIGIALTGFTACKGGATVKKLEPQAVVVGECCRQTEALRAQLPNCCAAMLTGGQLSPCCEVGSTPGAEQKPCCAQAAELIGKVGKCCLDAMQGKKPLPCCRGG